MNELTDLNNVFSDFQEKQKLKHDNFLHDVESRIKYQKYSHDNLINFFPFENEIFGMKKGVVVDDPNEINKDIQRSSFDEKDRLIMTESVLSGNRVTSRTFFCYKDDFIERVIFQKVGSFRLKSMARFFNEKGNVRLLNKGVMGEGCWYFNYIDNILNDILIKEKDTSSEYFQTRNIFFKYDFRNDLIEVRNQYENGTSQVMYSKS